MQFRHARLALPLLALTPVLIVLLVSCTDLDLRLADAFYDYQGHQFPWRHAWLTEVFGHLILKRCLLALASVFIATAAWDALRPLPWSPLRRLQCRIVAQSALLIPAITSLSKSFSHSHCPWDLERYGGSAPYFRLLDAFPSDMAPGQCLPAGHASSALWLIALAVYFYPHRPRAAAATFCLALAAGMGLGWMQQMRGAHFFSHTLWSAWIACAVLFALLRWQGLRAYRA